MDLLRQITEKPWLPQSAVERLHAERAIAAPAAKIGLRFFLAVVSVLFLLLVIAYAERMRFEAWRPGPQPVLLWLNTVLLVLGSVGLQWARVAANRQQIDGVRKGLMIGGFFTVAFLAGQIAAWRQLSGIPFFNMASPAIAFFYLITALHGVHIMGGLVAWGRATARAWQASAVVRPLQGSVDLCAIYWHFLLLVWLVLFGLLFSGNGNIDLLLALCGFR
jgi:cytochrome c oxidase subunit 3